jgi:hypothetical protein
MGANSELTVLAQRFARGNFAACNEGLFLIAEFANSAMGAARTSRKNQREPSAERGKKT